MISKKYEETVYVKSIDFNDQKGPIDDDVVVHCPNLDVIALERENLPHQQIDKKNSIIPSEM